ncbi:MAG: PEGA domain-containing protein [Abditibacteriales bacterium]|nr:PEGA domain-containing protein [Abditibacteriales bacterium]MDW8365008.1 PEGA domain-containing protein [Abditibacteriales bacterium]
MNHFMRSVAVAGFTVVLWAVSGCGGGKGLVASNSDRAQSAATLDAPAMSDAKLARGRRKGTLDISSNPAGARIFLDGRDTGLVTPALIKKVEPGTYTVRLVLGDAVYINEAVSVIPGRRTRLFVSPLQQPTVHYITVSSRTLNASGGVVVFEVSAVQAGVPAPVVQLTITRANTTVATLVLDRQPNTHIYVGSFPFPANPSTTTPAIYSLSFSISNGLTQPSIVNGGNVTVQPDADVPPPLPPL